MGFLLLLSSGWSSIVSATITDTLGPDEKGHAIALEADKRDSGFVDMSSNMKMILKNNRGGEAVRLLRVRTLEQVNNGDKSLLIFDSPRDVKGTSLLSFTHKFKADDQWLYLPTLKRVKRISQANQSGPFVGSEFAYEDISSQEIEKYTYKYIRDEVFDSRDHYVVEADPVNPKSGYSRQLVWLDKDHFRIWKIEYFDKKGLHLKTMTASDFNRYLGKYWRPGLRSMVNHVTGKTTDLVFSDFVFQSDLDVSTFTKTALQKVR